MATVTGTAGSAPAPGRPKRKAPVVPPQHGAWGFLALPLVLAGAVSGWSFDLLLLAVTWVAAYPASWAVSGMLTAKRPERFRRAALIWSPAALLAGVPLLVRHPWLSWVLIAYLVLFAANLQLARRGRERSMTNDLVLIAECALLVPVASGLAAGAAGFPVPWAAMSAGPVLVAALLCALTLVGSTLHVKSLIRERRNPAFTRASRVFALACPPVVVVLALMSGEEWWLGLPFLALAARALWLHDPTWRPGRIGMIELLGLVLVALSALVAL